MGTYKGNEMGERREGGKGEVLLNFEVCSKSIWWLYLLLLATKNSRSNAKPFVLLILDFSKLMGTH